MYRLPTLALLMLALALPPAFPSHALTPDAPQACNTIPELQGSGNSSPCKGRRANIQGCITGVTATGFFFQDLAGDGATGTSDGIYAYLWSSWTNPNNLKPGDLVSVSGTVTEYYGTTEFAHRSADPLQVTVTGSCPLPAPVSALPYLDPFADPQLLYEHTESMRVAMSFDGWVVGPTQRYTSRYPAGDPEIALVDYASTIPDDSRVFERDYPGYQGITYINGGLGQGLPDLDFGDLVSGSTVTGILSYQYGKYTLLVDDAGQVQGVDEPHVPLHIWLLDPARGEFDICYFNTENLFDHINDGHGDWGDWAPGWPVSGTAEGEALYRQKLDAVALVIAAWLGGCALVGLEEVEGKQQVWDDLVAEFIQPEARITGRHTWTGRYVESGDPRDISQGFLIRDDVTLLGGSLVPVTGAPYTGWVADGSLDFVRTPAAGQFRFNAGTPNEVTLWAYNLHFKSKSSNSSCTTPDCTDRREREAADLRDILLHHQTAGEYAIGGGNLNDTHGSSPISIMDGGGPQPGPRLTGLWYELAENKRYSHIYNGESEALDHVYVTNLTIGTRPWKRSLVVPHVQADFAARKRTSDHDPLRVIFWVPAEEERRLFLPIVLRTTC